MECDFPEEIDDKDFSQDYPSYNVAEQKIIESDSDSFSGISFESEENSEKSGELIETLTQTRKNSLRKDSELNTPIDTEISHRKSLLNKERKSILRAERKSILKERKSILKEAEPKRKSQSKSESEEEEESRSSRPSITQSNRSLKPLTTDFEEDETNSQTSFEKQLSVLKKRGKKVAPPQAQNPLEDSPNANITLFLQWWQNNINKENGSTKRTHTFTEFENEKEKRKSEETNISFDIDVPSAFCTYQPEFNIQSVLKNYNKKQKQMKRERREKRSHHIQFYADNSSFSSRIQKIDNSLQSSIRNKSNSRFKGTIIQKNERKLNIENSLFAGGQKT